MELDIQDHRPDHGPIWRTDPKIIKAYVKWAGRNQKAVVTYETMWNSTEKMAVAIVEGWSQRGLTPTHAPPNFTEVTSSPKFSTPGR